MVIFHYIEIIWRILVTLEFSYNIISPEIYYPDEPVDIHVQSLLILSIRTIGYLPQNIIRVNHHYLVVMDNW